MIETISHITFIVKDLEKATVFFERIFDAKEVYSSGAKQFSISKEKFFLIGEIWIAVMEGTPIDKSYNHVAFKIAPTEFEYYLQKIEQLGLEILKGRSRIDGEGKSIYFYDFDNHLFELHTGTLQDRLLEYRNH